MLESTLLYVLLILAVAIGWSFGFRYAKQSKSSHSVDWIPSVDLLLDQSNDKTVEKLLKVEKVDDDYIDLFLKLGRSLRDKGEIDRATHLHQKLFARPDLEKHTLQQIQLELAIDYEKAGLLDRAERLFRELLEVKGAVGEQAVKHLIELLEDEGEWQSILDLHLSKKIHSSSISLRRVSHACCELAEKELNKKDYTQTRRYANQALKAHSRCARAYVLLGDIAFFQDEYSEAIRCFLKSIEYDQQSLIRIMDKFIQAFQSVGDTESLRKHLLEHWRKTRYIPALVANIQVSLHESSSPDHAVDQLLEELSQHPSTQGFLALTELVMVHRQQLDKSQLLTLYDILRTSVAREPQFVCSNCGFSVKEPYWRCPSCKGWSTVKAAVPSTTELKLKI